MDINFFLTERTKTIRFLYETAAHPFLEIIRKIEAEESPYEPIYSEDGEPPFLVEWGEAQQGLQLLGFACLSFLSDALNVFFRTWESQLHLSCQVKFKSEFKNHGFVNGYKRCFGDALGDDWSACPVNWEIVEQVVLARNNTQHTDHIAVMSGNHTDSDRKKFAIPFFLEETERNMLINWPDMPSWLNPEIAVNRDSLMTAIHQIELLGDWLEPRLSALLYPD